MNPILNKCPVCSGALIATRLHCPSCETTLEGSFQPGGSPLQEAFSAEQLRSLLPFARLSQEQLYFILTFVRCEGRFNRMEEELDLSYPTLRGRLDEVIRAMGFEPPREEPRLPGPPERQAILDMLNRGEIDVEAARRRLRGEPAAMVLPAAEVLPAAVEQPAADATPVAQEQPAADATPVAQELPAADATPVAQELPAPAGEPSGGETASGDNTPGSGEPLAGEPQSGAVETGAQPDSTQSQEE